MALAEHSQMSTHMLGFQPFSGLLHCFVLDKLASSRVSDNFDNNLKTKYVFAESLNYNRFLLFCLALLDSQVYIFTKDSFKIFKHQVLFEEKWLLNVLITNSLFNIFLNMLSPVQFHQKSQLLAAVSMNGLISMPS